MHFKKKPKKMIALNEDFTCQSCGRFVQSIKTGGSYRNHCPFCLSSKHVDTDTPGDRKNECQAIMSAISSYSKKTGEYVLLHECTQCKFRRYNRIAGDDNMDLVIELSTNPIHINS